MTRRRFPPQRTTVVTGGGSPRGIGRALAGRLTEHGWSVAVLDIDGDAAGAVADELARHGPAVAGYQVDLADRQAVMEVARRVEQDLPPVVGLANVAGVASPVSFFDLTEKEWDRVFDINAKGQFFVTQAFLRGMVDRGVGRIVSVASASAQRGGGTYSKVAYSAAKAAVLGMTRAGSRGGTRWGDGQRRFSGADRHRHHGGCPQRGTTSGDDRRPRRGPARHGR